MFVVDVDDALSSWTAEHIPAALGVVEGEPVGWYAEWRPVGGNGSCIQELQTGAEVCRFDTLESPTFTRNGFLVGGDALGFDCEPAWAIELRDGETVFPLDRAILIANGVSGAWDYLS